MLLFWFITFVIATLLGIYTILRSTKESTSNGALLAGLVALMSCPMAASDILERMTKPEPGRFSVVIEEPDLSEDVPIGTPLTPVTEDLTLHIPTIAEGRGVTSITSAGEDGLMLHFEGNISPSATYVSWEDVGNISIKPQN